MILIGDIGNTNTKICLLNKKYEILKKLILPTIKINHSYLKKKLNFLFKKKIVIDNSLFCSVVPHKFLNTFSKIANPLQGVV